MPGSNISRGEATGQSQITSIEIDGFWLLTGEEEYFISFGNYSAHFDKNRHLWHWKLDFRQNGQI